MNSISDLINRVKEAFKNKTYRHAYVDEFLNVSIATQIKVLREQRGWSQAELAREAQMKQPRVSVMENVNYSSWSINSLRKLAEAFDLALCVSFESFGKRLRDIDLLNRKALERPSFDDDPDFVERREEKVTAASKALPDVTRPDVIRPMRVVPAQSAEASQGKISFQGNENGSKNMSIIEAGGEIWRRLQKEAIA
ncbi:MAG: helix-turn-helix domain-containing protein [Thermodesulfobacteriota bacterium]